MTATLTPPRRSRARSRRRVAATASSPASPAEPASRSCSRSRPCSSSSPSRAGTASTLPRETYRPATDFLGYIGPLVLSTILVAMVALIVAVPFAIAIALFISHYAPRRIAAPVAYVVDLLAAVPSVVFGLWGGRYLASFLQPAHVWLSENMGFIPFFAGPPSPNGRSLFTSGIVLAIMILPIITAISREVFAQTPRLHEEAALALGATRWEMVRYSVFPYARSGMVSGVMLGLGRALGETMAVAMVLAVSPVATLNIIGTAAPPPSPRTSPSTTRRRPRAASRCSSRPAWCSSRSPSSVNFAARWIVGRATGAQAGTIMSSVTLTPRPAPAVGARARRRDGPGRVRPAGDAPGLEHRELARPGRLALPDRAARLVAGRREPSRRHRPVDDEPDLDGVRLRGAAARVVDLRGHQRGRPGHQRRVPHVLDARRDRRRAGRRLPRPHRHAAHHVGRHR